MASKVKTLEFESYRVLIDFNCNAKTSTKPNLTAGRVFFSACVAERRRSQVVAAFAGVARWRLWLEPAARADPRLPAGGAAGRRRRRRRQPRRGWRRRRRWRHAPECRHAKAAQVVIVVCLSALGCSSSSLRVPSSYLPLDRVTSTRLFLDRYSISFIEQRERRYYYS